MDYNEFAGQIMQSKNINKSPERIFKQSVQGFNKCFDSFLIITIRDTKQV